MQFCLYACFQVELKLHISCTSLGAAYGFVQSVRRDRRRRTLCFQHDLADLPRQLSPIYPWQKYVFW